MMVSGKRKFLVQQPTRRIRPRRGPSEQPEDLLRSPASPTTLDVNMSRASDSENDAETGEVDIQHVEVDSGSGSEPEPPASVSFGALVKAQANLQYPMKNMGKRLLGENGKKATGRSKVWEDSEAVERKAGRKDNRDFNRSSKHAPAELSSKKAVSRKRDVIPVMRREYRDPRFESLSGPLDEAKVQKTYSFLDGYRLEEMKELKSVIKKTEDEMEKENLKRVLLSMESKMKAQERKKKEAEILDRHRKEEKGLVKQGKKPFYLKKSEQQKRLLVGRFSELKGKQLDRVLERRRKKIEGKEKKKMPWSRRAIEEGSS